MCVCVCVSACACVYVIVRERALSWELCSLVPRPIIFIPADGFPQLWKFGSGCEWL